MTQTLLTADRTAFRDALPQGGRLLGMDVGTKTIGLALCDAGWSIASPAHTVARGKFSKDKVALAAFIEQQQVRGLVIGLPLNLDGSESPRSQASRAFARNVLRLRDLPIAFWDERLSSAAVNRMLIDEADVTRARRADLVDKAAAAWILQGALERLRQA